MSRRKAREVAFKILFKVDLVQEDPAEALFHLDRDFIIKEEYRDFVTDLVMGTLKNLMEIDRQITQFSPDWPVERMPTVDRNLLRMAAYEIIYVEDIHPVVAINEAVDLAKIYGDDNSRAFINAILDRIKDASS